MIMFIITASIQSNDRNNKSMSALQNAQCRTNRNQIIKPNSKISRCKIATEIDIKTKHTNSSLKQYTTTNEQMPYYI